ncbi:MAG TPA: beta-L-arabinofuranosidase domain-containing protein [Phycisphaerae bacterium]|nr:beta-L-arabinofuranosidase domain-containing protein [Phycisphaerae bacterium]
MLSRRNFLSASLAATAASLTARLARAADPAAPFKQAIPFAVAPIPLESVRLAGGPLGKAQDLGIQNILRLDPDRLLYHFRLLAGLDPKADRDYGGWEGPGRQLTGHMAGHYLSACSLMYAATGDERLQSAADYMVDQLADVQAKRGNGYFGALMGNPPGPPRGRARAAAGSQPASRAAPAGPLDGLLCFQQLSTGDIRASAFDLNGMWSPWYVQHKLLAGLRDAYRRTRNAKALDVAAKFAAWTDTLLAPLSQDQLQQMLACEFGGINESFADLYADTGDKRWLALSQKFRHKAVVDPLAAQHDILGGKHGNTQVPKLLGELVRYINAGNAPDGDAAKFFWNAVVYHHSFATGGHGYDEYFDAPDKLSDEIDGANHRTRDLRTAESCNVYNMLKLTRLLFALHPDEQFAAFHERALFNHVLASISFNDGQLCYMVPVSPGVTHEYQGLLGMTCCCGTGLENHALHGEGLYYHSPSDLYVNLFAPSNARSELLAANLAMQTDFPEKESATLTIKTDAPREFTLHLRRPAWATGNYTVSLNGQPLPNLPAPGAYLELKRNWTTDSLAVTLPRSLRFEPLPDNPRRGAFMQGPLVLAADLGEVQSRGRRGNAPAQNPTLTADAQSADKILTPSAAGTNTFTATANPNPLTFAPFYTLSNRRYGIYWDLTAPA